MDLNFEIHIQTNFNYLFAYLETVKAIAKEWETPHKDKPEQKDDPVIVPWFRGQQSSKWELMPGVFRTPECDDKKIYDEFWLFRRYRDQASILGEHPEYDKVDQWLFFMQHNKLPTRLLDWTESSLIALYFALKDYRKNSPDEFPTIYMIHPFKLNEFITGSYSLFPPQIIIAEYYFKMVDKQFIQSKNQEKIDVFTDYKKEALSAVSEHSILLEKLKSNYLEYPIAVQSTHCHSNMKAQRSGFTIHGHKERGFEEIPDDSEFKNKFFKKIILKCTGEDCREMLADLRSMGITESTIYSDFEGLAEDLKGWLLKDKYK